MKGKRETTMANENEVKTNGENKPAEPEKITVKRKLFDLGAFKTVSKESEISFNAPLTVAEFLERLGNEEAKILKVGTAGLRRIAIQDAKRELGGDNLVSPKVISNFVNQFRPNFPLDPKDGDDKAQRKAQTKRVFDMLASSDALKAAIVTIAKATIDTGDDDDEDTDAGE